MSERLTKSYNKLFVELENNLRRNDTEGVHSVRDKILKKFAKDIASGTIEKISDAKTIATLINSNLGQIKTQLWYA